ncbi:MAG TPA: hypothetical protein VGL21_16730, partial [Jatrophihabitantaceae bacterium]
MTDRSDEPTPAAAADDASADPSPNDFALRESAGDADERVVAGQSRAEDGASGAVGGDGDGDGAPTPGAKAARRLRPVHVRAGALIGVLTALLGFGIAVQVRSNSS